MAEHPSWDYWRYDDVGNGRFVSIYEGRWLSDADIRNEEFDLDEKRWCREYWDASQAAAISFGRDPDKVKNADDSLSIVDAEDRAKHSELVDHIDNLEGLIRDAQIKKELLPSPIFLPEQYIKWARRVGVDFPLYVENELAVVKAERTIPKRPGDSVDLSADVDGSEHQSQKGKGPQAKKENSFLKLILALWEMTDFKKKDSDSVDELAGIILVALGEKAKAERNGKFSLEIATIRAHLIRARDLYKN